MPAPRLIYAIKRLGLVGVLTLTILAVGSPRLAHDFQSSFRNGVGVCKRTTARLVLRVESTAKKFAKSTFGYWTNPYKSSP
jgi:hypothetical protein